MELSEEEKKAIEYLENRLDILHNNTQWATEKSIKVVLNLTKKQQKEIERLKKDNIQVIYGGRRFGTEGMVVKDYISKDKIREKIEELESLSKNITMQPSIYNYEIDLLKELLEEN